MNKYEILRDGPNAGRIRALRSFGDVVEGAIGGFVEHEGNLSHEGNCWVFEDAMIRGNAKIFDNVWVFGSAGIAGNAKIFDNAWVFGNAVIAGNAKIFDNARVSGNARVFENAKIFGSAEIAGHAIIDNEAVVSGEFRVFTIEGLIPHPIHVTDNHIKVGCEFHSIDEWKERYKDIGALHQYSETHIEMFRTILEMADGIRNNFECLELWKNGYFIL